ncbi:hypothetical protein GQX73_g3771 [Xylaria multiplex]|uniref:Methyltransferase type 11 domain-containing protein n=1 Tax=Xylaria multiplex TaxID=323545 RepID=A0A7C8MRP6_9PEZI|nr:hypothetical protein GQX73_g3771 [Xylaria multiplex]
MRSSSLRNLKGPEATTTASNNQPPDKMGIATFLKRKIQESHSFPRPRRSRAELQEPMRHCFAEPPGCYPSREFIAPVAAALGGNQKVLQIGAMKAGAIAFSLASAAGPNSHVTAVTGPGETTDSAREMARQLNKHNVTFLDVPDLTNLPFADKFFDVVYACNVMAHLPPSQNNSNAVKLLREMERVTKPSGVIASRDLAAQHFFPNTDIEPLFTDTLLKATGLQT